MATQRNARPFQQMDLLGGSGGEPAQIHRLFFALVPDDVLRQRFARAADVLRGDQTIRARWVVPARYHATLHFLGDFPQWRQDVADAAKAAADKVGPRSFDWTLDYLAGFRGRQPPCVLRGTEVPVDLVRLWQDLREALIRAGAGSHIGGGNFTPHVTLGYSHGTVPDIAQIEPILWRVKGYALIHSIVGEHEYRVLGRWGAIEQ
ncbi:2'-5' RNA ligase family protein [Dyella sp.]|uniref:2'-5' RNA ligase family protein n=1 Tax=Dyella sp. TaxID=1869338 RepID=UPI002ED6811F